jgi:hypothetical protein
MTFQSAKSQFTPASDFCINFDADMFYINGVQKSVSADLTAVGDGYTGTDLSWLTPEAFTVVVEYSVPETGVTLGGNNMCIFSLYNTSGTAFRFELYLVDSDASCCAQVSVYSSALETPSFMTSAVDGRSMGRHRFAITVQTGAPPLLAMDCEPITTASGEATTGTFNKLGVGIRALDNTQQASEVTLHKVEVINGAKTQAQLEAIMDASDQGLRPLLVIGSSLNNKNDYSVGGGVWSQVLKDATNRYLPFLVDSVGGTSPTQHAARWLAMPERYRSFDLVWSEIGLDGDEVAYQAAIESVRAVHTGRLAIVEPQRDLRATAGTAIRLNVDAVRAWLETYTAANEYLYITTLEEMQANDPTDSYVVDDDTWPSSAYIDIVTDPIHHNEQGRSWLGAALGVQLAAARWT